MWIFMIIWLVFDLFLVIRLWIFFWFLLFNRFDFLVIVDNNFSWLYIPFFNLITFFLIVLVFRLILCRFAIIQIFFAWVFYFDFIKIVNVSRNQLVWLFLWDFRVVWFFNGHFFTWFDRINRVNIFQWVVNNFLFIFLFIVFDRFILGVLFWSIVFFCFIVLVNIVFFFNFIVFAWVLCFFVWIRFIFIFYFFIFNRTCFNDRDNCFFIRLDLV